MRKNFLVFLFFTVIVFLVNIKSLGLTMYADDWIIMAKFFAIFGPGDPFPYWRIDTWFADYGWQNITPILFAIFGYTYWVYFAINLLIKGLVALAVYLFAKKVFDKKVGFVSGLFFAATAIGIETTDWVYNMSSWLGIAIALFGFTYLIGAKNLRKSFFGWAITLFGYAIASIRIFMVPPLLILVETIRWLFAKKEFTKTTIGSTAKYVLTLLGVIFVFRYFTPFLGNPTIALFYVNIGMSTARKLIEMGRIDFLMYPFVTVGQMLVPYGLGDLTAAGARIYPISHFVIFGGILAFLSSVFIFFAFGKRITKNLLFMSAAYSIFVLGALKIFVRYQGEWMLKDFHNFATCYFGIIFVSVVLYKFIESLKKKDAKKTIFYLIAGTATLGFLFPQIVNPGITFAPIHRYLAYGSVGMALLLGKFLVPRNFDTKFIQYGKFAFIAGILLVNIVEVDRFYSFQLTGRNVQIEGEIFRQLQVLVPDYPQDESVIFYFEYPHYKTYYDLLLNSFGFHMQLLYKKPYDEGTVISSVDNYTALLDQVVVRKAPIDHIYGFKWVGPTPGLGEGGHFVDISEDMREQVERDLNTAEQ